MAPSHGAEAHPTLLGLRHLDVGELADRDQDTPALLVRQRQQAHFGPNRVGEGLLDLLRRLRALEDQLPGRILHPDLDLHLLTSAACRTRISYVSISLGRAACRSGRRDSYFALSRVPGRLRPVSEPVPRPRPDGRT